MDEFEQQHFFLASERRNETHSQLLRQYHQGQGVNE